MKENKFYLTFWRKLKDYITEIINYTLFVKKELPESMKTAIISMIPKKDSNKTDIVEWRPLLLGDQSLLCVDHNIFTKAHTIEQSAAVPKRIIYTNLFTTRHNRIFK